MSFPRLQWRRELLLLAVCLMEVCWLYPWATLLIRFADGGAERRVSALALLAVLLLALYLTRILSSMDISLLAQRLTTLGAAVLSVLVVLWIHLLPRYRFTDWHWLLSTGRHALDFSAKVPHEWSIFLMAAYLWWRGIGLAQRTLGPQIVGLYFRWGIVAYIWFGLASLLWGGLSDHYSLIFAFFFFGLFAVALARAEDITRRRMGVHSPFNMSWLGILLGGTVTVLLLGAGFASLLSVSGVRALLQWLSPVLSVLQAAFNAVIIALAYLLQPLMAFLVRLGQRFLG